MSLAAARLATDGLLTLTETGGPAALVTLVAGEPVRGNWWSHRAGNAIYAAAIELDADPEAWSLKLVDGKVGWLHRSLWGALLRVVEDPRWRDPREAALDAGARALLARVRAEGEVEVPAAERRAREAVEGRLLAPGRSVHGVDGRHHASLLTWTRFAGGVGPDPELDYDTALARLTAACRGRGLGLPLTSPRSSRSRRGGRS